MHRFRDLCIVLKGQSPQYIKYCWVLDGQYTDLYCSGPSNTHQRKRPYHISDRLQYQYHVLAGKTNTIHANPNKCIVLVSVLVEVPWSTVPIFPSSSTSQGGFGSSNCEGSVWNMVDWFSAQSDTCASGLVAKVFPKRALLGYGLSRLFRIDFQNVITSSVALQVIHTPRHAKSTPVLRKVCLFIFSDQKIKTSSSQSLVAACFCNAKLPNSQNVPPCRSCHFYFRWCGN
jgi:hypothetical protein